MQVLKERTFTCDGENMYPGYLVEDGGNLFPAFTNEQMRECQRIQAELVAEYGNEEYARLDECGGLWRELYFDGLWATYEPVRIGGMELYFLGANEWPWE